MSEQILLRAPEALVPLLWRLCSSCMSVQAMQSSPAILDQRDFEGGIQVMNHADWPRALSWDYSFVPFPPPPRKFGPSNAEIERNFGAFRNYPLHSDAMNREMIGSGSVRGNGWVREKKSGESAQLYPPNNFKWIASSLHDKRFAPEMREPVAPLCRLCFALIGAVKFYDINSQQYNVYHTYRAALRSSSISCTH